MQWKCDLCLKAVPISWNEKKGLRPGQYVYVNFFIDHNYYSLFMQAVSHVMVRILKMIANI